GAAGYLMSDLNQAWPPVQYQTTRHSQGPLSPLEPEHHAEPMPPVCGQTDAGELKIRPQKSKDGLAGRMKCQCRCNEQETRWVTTKSHVRKISLTLKIACLQMAIHAHPVVQRLKWQLQVAGCLQFDDREPSMAVDPKQIDHIAPRRHKY